MVNFHEDNRLRSACVRLSVVILTFAVCLGTLRSQDISPPADTVVATLSNDIFRTERTPVAGGSEIVTIFARKDGPEGDLPLVSVLRDTLGDGIAGNDRLRYVWVHSYARPSAMQKLASFVPFFYSRATNKDKVGDRPPPSVVDLAWPAGSGGWDTLFWQVFKRVLFADTGHLFKASVLGYRENKEDHRRVAIATAMAVLSLYQGAGGERVLTEQELRDVQARLALKDKPLGPYLQSEYLERVFTDNRESQRDERAQNWELLRQMCESQHLFFQPLTMPDGTARHAVVWVAQEDLAVNKDRKFDSRFLNIKSPWRDQNVAAWKGYKDERWYDSDDREVEVGTAAAVTKRTLIPLAVYGLDYPKIPVVLVDFRDNGNPKKREMSRRTISDVLNNVLSVSQFTNMPFFVGRFAFDFVTGRRGMDVNQPSRLQAYAQLKLLLKLDESLDADLRSEMAKRVESATLNPMENDTDVEERVARQQYKNLIAWAADDKGLAKKIANDRREEMVRIKHPQLPVRFALSFMHYATAGIYTHRETSTPELMADLDRRRQLDYHERYVREVAFRSNDPEIDANIDKLKVSLAFLSTGGKEAGAKTARSLARLFTLSSDDEMRSLCLAGLYRIDSMSAKRELVAIYQNQKVPDHWREASARYLKQAADEGQRMSKDDARTVSAIVSIN